MKMKLKDLVIVLAGYDAVMSSLETELGYAEHFYTRACEIPTSVLECEVMRVKRGNVFAVDVSKYA
jgi:hypothetical protein